MESYAFAKKNSIKGNLEMRTNFGRNMAIVLTKVNDYFYINLYNNNPRNPVRCSLGYDEFCELVNMKEALEQLFKEFEEQEQPMQHPPQHHSPQTAKGLLPLTSQATPPPPYTAQHLRVLNHSNKRSMDSKEGDMINKKPKISGEENYNPMEYFSQLQ
ncbi:unnamed protein product [Mytilus coruscus]|uniref:Uncharacterized protein n=1 Tax=Mytilus coruscus TaxID=42192 RepID=A0A6J8AIM1_MYTCO|nr:unnamed protein product [Mytilus coruscus]